MKKKTVIIGIDGAPYGLIRDLSDQGVMPYFGQLKKQGIFRKMQASIPHISSVSWSSIITGKNPGQHGIFGFTEIMPGTYSLAFPDFTWLKVKPFWLKDKNKKYIILNVPSTYPVQALKGVHISGFISLDLAKAVYPNQYLGQLTKMNYQVDVDSGLAHQSKTLFLEKLSLANEARIKAYQYFWNQPDWHVFMLVFTGSDRLMHFFWDAYENKKHLHHQDFLNYFKRVDETIGQISQQLDKNDALIILSDHGMEKIKTNFNVNYFLRKQGFLELDKSRKNYNQITQKTQAFALDPGRIYLNKAGRYPRGSVKQSDAGRLIKNLINAFSHLKFKGQKVIKKIYQKQEIYQGPQLARAPDLVLLENAGFRLRGNIDKQALFEQDIFTGKHNAEAFLFIRGKKYAKIMPRNLTVEDIVYILKNL